jgi:hypothetical protein
VKDAEALAHATAQVEKDEPLEPAEGAKVLFYGADGADAEHATITKVWSPTCVNLDNGKTSVYVLPIGATDIPTGYYCVLFADEPEERDDGGSSALRAKVRDDKAFREDLKKVYDAAIDVVHDAPCFRRLEHAQALPEVPGDAETIDIGRPEGGIELFKDEDRRTMRIVFTPTGIAKQAVPDEA